MATVSAAHESAARRPKFEAKFTARTRIGEVLASDGVCTSAEHDYRRQPTIA
jgi:hypothetical protein